MQTRTLGRTGLDVSVLGLGCGVVGGVMVRGSPADRERVVARALECGVTYFDTAPAYGDGESERNLGQVLRQLRPQVMLGTKVRIAEAEKAGIAAAVAASLDASLRRLGREQVDLFQLHNPITSDGAGEALTPAAVLDQVVPAFQAMRDAGKARFLGFTAVGDTAALHALAGSGAFDTAQVCHNMLNPSVATPMPPGRPGQDYRQLLAPMQQAGTGAIGIRVLAGGALSGTASRHPVASPPPAPIGSGPDYAADVAQARRLLPLVEEGFAATLAEAALRYAVYGSEAVATTLVGVASVEQFEAAALAIGKGPLAPETHARVQDLLLA